MEMIGRRTGEDAGDHQTDGAHRELLGRLEQVSLDELDFLVQQKCQVAREGGHQLAQRALAQRCRHASSMSNRTSAQTVGLG